MCKMFTFTGSSFERYRAQNAGQTKLKRLYGVSSLDRPAIITVQ